MGSPFATTRCDFCFLLAPLKEVHRSLCKTKNYCSQECRDADDKAHKVCCKQGSQVEERKVKVGGKEKTKVADALVKDLATTLVSKLGTEKGKRENFENAVNHCKNLMENIELREERRQRAAEGRAHDVDEVD